MYTYTVWLLGKVWFLGLGANPPFSSPLTLKVGPLPYFLPLPCHSLPSFPLPLELGSLNPASGERFKLP